uniref:WAP domain-containing protein n=1 Tax=Trichuris muris TaxID=70415 RepID=A0A5S6Q000_TRIMR
MLRRGQVVPGEAGEMNARYMHDEPGAIAFMQEHGRLHRDRQCECGNAMVLRTKTLSYYGWRCGVKTCRKEVALRSETWLEGTHLPIRAALLFIHAWSIQKTSSYCEEYLGMNKRAAVQWNLPMRVVIAGWLLRNPVAVGGPDLTDEANALNATFGQCPTKEAMTAQWFHVCLATLVLLSFPAGEGRKIGLCPKLLVEVAEDAIDRCDRDENCEGRNICCRTVKGRMCMAPIEVRAVARNEFCPPFVGSRKADAVDRCERDGDCPTGRFCCESVIGNMCMKPEPVEEARRPGVCPRLSAQRKADAVDRCLSDSECAAEDICCETVAGKVCMRPETVQSAGMYRQGKCPKVPVNRLVGLRNRCQLDTDCEDGWICCQTVRGKMCLKPKT